MADMPSLDDTTVERARLIAMTVRNAMEEVHGGNIEESLTDAQMARINPIIRNAVATALHALDHLSEPPAAKFLGFQAMLIPSYWEEPTLLDDYVELWADRKGV
ncbi:MAG TPA: hypothetical protein VFS66_12775 [Acidimicrobiia bacterium]|nr:hypothetical protein [Acidimicrobiia bacterium]